MSKPITDLIHHPYVPPAGFAAPQPGVFKASTVIFPNVAAMRARDWKNKNGYTYGLHGTPTTFMLEERIASLEGGKHCILVPSGLAAIANVSMALLKSGDEVLIPDNAYGPNKALADGELKNWGITHQLYDAMNPADLQRAHRPQDAGWSGWKRRARSPWSSCRWRELAAHLPRARRDHGAGQHLGRRHRLQRLRPGGGRVRQRRRHRGAGADQVPQRRRRRADGQHRHARRRAAPAAQAHAHAPGLGRRRATTPRPSCARCPAMPLRYRAQDAAARALAALAGVAAGNRAVAAPGVRRLARATSTGASCAAARQAAVRRPAAPRRACSRWCSTRASARPRSTPSATR